MPPTKLKLTVRSKNLSPAPRVTSDALLGAWGELLIMHDGREYRLRLTRNGKLILTA